MGFKIWFYKILFSTRFAFLSLSDNKGRGEEFCKSPDSLNLLFFCCCGGCWVEGVGMQVLGNRCWETGVGRRVLGGGCWETGVGRRVSGDRG